jgi:hypothetical protein
VPLLLPVAVAVGGLQSQHGFFVLLITAAVGGNSRALLPRSIVLPIFSFPSSLSLLLSINSIARYQIGNEIVSYSIFCYVDLYFSGKCYVGLNPPLKENPLASDR